MKKDNSKEIFDKFYASKNRMVIVSLKDGTELQGRFVSFFHGDEDSGHFIERWHFVETKDLEKYNSLFSIDGTEVGKMIWQKDILNVKFME